MANNSNKETKFNSGNMFGIEDDDSTIYFFGKLLGGKLTETEGEVPVVYGDGTGFAGPGGLDCKFSVTIAQCTNENIAKINKLAGELRKAFYQNGTTVGGVKQDIYIPELKIKRTKELDMKGQTLQTIVIEGSCAPQDADVSITPSEIMPEGFPTKEVETAVTSNSPFYVLPETEG